MPSRRSTRDWTASEEFQRRRFADQEVLVKNLGSDLGTIRERTQDTDTRLRTLKDEIDALRQTFLSLPGAHRAVPGGRSTRSIRTIRWPRRNPPPGGAPPWRHVLLRPALHAADPAGLSPNRMFETAFSDYSVVTVRRPLSPDFSSCRRTFPTAERADDAQFFIGESLANMNRLPEAIDAYNLVIQKYPNGDQVDMAYYRRGFVESQMGRTDAATCHVRGGRQAVPRTARVRSWRGSGWPGRSRPPAAPPAKP